MVFRIKLAEQLIEIRSIYESIYYYCSGYVVESKPSESPSIIIQITQEDIDKEAEDLQKKAGADGNAILNWTPCYLEELAINRFIASAMLKFDTMLMHGAVISTDGAGYMISAPSGTGKSTRSAIWVNTIPNSFIVNGDKPLLRIANNIVYAYGTPWCGKEYWNKNTHVPLSAILFLERANDLEEDSVHRLSMEEGFLKLYQQAYLPSEPESLRKTLKLLKAIANNVSIYRFKSAPTAEAVKLAYETVLSNS